MANGSFPVPAGVAPAAGMVPGIEHYGRYHLIERIGRGGMAEVFRAVAQGVEGFRRVFVIKRLRPEKLDSADLVRMFCDEARLSALLHHPNVVQVYDFGQIGGTYFLAMEYLRGQDLSAVMKANRAMRAAVSAPIAAHIAQQVATGLHYAHTLTRMDGRALTIVHRDVTPSNIMLQRTGAVKILDFGIAQATNFARQVETGGGRVKGKLAYLSPEQVRLEELDGRSDVFALGVVLWEMLTGQRLFSSENDFLTMRNVLTQPIPAPSSLRPDVPVEMDAIVARALKRDRNQRYADARALADDLEDFLRAFPCDSHALAHLLQDLFGDEAAEHTPDLPDDLPERAFADAATHAPGAIARIPSFGGEIEIEAEAATAAAAVRTHFSVARRPALPDHRPLLRGVIAAVSAASLIACLSWALGRSTRPPEIAAAAWTPPPALATTERADSTAARPQAAMLPRLVASPSDPVSTTPTLARHPARRRPARHLSREVTFDPFK
jgi:eukaryotic-like serine/threonine-protein kinase